MDISWDFVEKQLLEEMRKTQEQAMVGRFSVGVDRDRSLIHQSHGWRKITDDLPEKDNSPELHNNVSKRCVVRYEGNDRTARYDFDKEQWICCVRGTILYDITYWMPIPDLKED